MDGGAMRQPARKLAPRQQVTQVEDPEFGTLLELPAIDIEGDPDANVLPFSEEEARDIPMRGHNPNRRRRPVTELEPIDIQGSRSADVAPFDMEALPKFADEPAFVPGAQAPVRRADGVSTMLPDWVPPWATEVIGQPVRGMGGSIDYELPEFIAELVADSEGQMPATAMDAAMGMGMNATPYGAIRQFAGTTPSRESRTVSPQSMLAGAANAGAVPVNALARLAGYDNLPAFLEELGVLDEGSGEEWSEGMDTTARQAPGSFSIGEMLGTAPMVAVPGASAGRGATVAGRAGLAALEGATYGGMEGMARSNAPTLSGQIQDAGRGMLAGAAFSGVLGGAAGEAARRSQLPVDEAAAARLMSDANIEWASQAGAAQSRKRMRQLLGGDAEQQIQNADFMGARMRDLGVTAPRGPRGILPPTQEQMGARFKAARERAQTGLESTHAAMEDRGPIELDTMLDPLRDRAAMLQRTPGGRPAGRSLAARVREFDQDYGTPVFDAADERAISDDDALAVFASGNWDRRPDASPAARTGEVTGYINPEAPFSELQRVKTQLFTPTGIDMNVEGERQRLYAAVRDRMQQAVDDADPAMGAAYRENRRTAEAGRRMSQMQADKTLQEAVNRRFSPSDYAMLATGLGGGAIPAMAADAASAGSVGIPMVVGAAVAGAANRAWRANEHGFQAMALERAARRLQTAPQRFGAWAQRLQAAQARGPQAFAAALYIAQQNDAAVREAVATEEDVQQMRDAGTAEQRTREEIQDYFSDTPQMTHPVAPSTEEEREAFFR